VLSNASRPNLLEQKDGLVDILRPNNRPGRQTEYQIPVVIQSDERRQSQVQSSQTMSCLAMRCNVTALYLNALYCDVMSLITPLIFIFLHVISTFISPV
jgi:hypothetical protein